MFFITRYKNKDGKIINLKEAAAVGSSEDDVSKSTSNTTDTSADSGTDDAATDTKTQDNTENDNDTEDSNDNTDGGDQQQDSATEDLDQDMDFGADNSSGDDGGSTDDSSSSTSSDTGNEEQEVDENKKIEEEIFSNLTHDQLDIKHKELKNRYLQLYDMTTEIIDRLSSIPIREDITFVVDYVSTTLSNLRDMVVDYINEVYKTKSYTENLINYNRFLATLEGINKILEEIDKTEVDKD